MTGLVAFACYYATLLPGLDLGDSASFQTGVGSLTLTPRQAYPLYYGLGSVFAWLDPDGPAHAMNLASAVFGALAAGLAAWLVADLTGSMTGGLAAGLFLAFSYTFWTQAITAEVYTLHLLLLGASMLALMAWARQPTPRRLAIFYGIYALGFGNHLSMILLLPAFTLFILMHRRRAAGDPLSPGMIALAGGMAFAGSLQYVWNLRGLWTDLEPPSSFANGVARFWFDVTKADWRETLVMGLSETGLQSRPAMYWFDLRQQFGVPGVLLAALGMAYVLARWPRRGLLLLLIYLANLAFAWTYNVGDAYIFFLPSHYALALCAGAGVVALMRLASRVTPNRTATALVGGLCLAYPAWRGYDTFPAVDRSWDDRASRLLDDFTSGNAAFGVDSNWQVQNAFEYYMREYKPFVSWFTTDDLLWLEQGQISEGLEVLLEGNRQLGREILVTPGVIRKLALNLESGTRNPEPGTPTLRARVEALPPGTPYALGILRSDREFPLDYPRFLDIWSTLTGGLAEPPPRLDYTIVVGEVGRAPLLVEARQRPYRVRTKLGPADFDIRMESWLPTDTIRRAGFGHVIINRRHALTLERGISLVVLGNGWEPSAVAYEGALFAPIPRFDLGMQGRQ